MACHGMGSVFTESQAACVPELTHFRNTSHVSPAFPSSKYTSLLKDRSLVCAELALLVKEEEQKL
jgi:hypothetical protein